tara:strand:- start:604 stop:759 length:156 start_codon:yes stop_codon:yes gene_type:complete
MNNLIKIREKIKREQRLHQAKILSLKKGEVTSYNSSIYKDRLKRIQKEMQE